MFLYCHPPTYSPVVSFVHPPFWKDGYVITMPTTGFAWILFLPNPPPCYGGVWGGFVPDFPVVGGTRSGSGHFSERKGFEGQVLAETPVRWGWWGGL